MAGYLVFNGFDSFYLIYSKLTVLQDILTGLCVFLSGGDGVCVEELIFGCILVSVKNFSSLSFCLWDVVKLKQQSCERCLIRCFLIIEKQKIILVPVVLKKLLVSLHLSQVKFILYFTAELYRFSEDLYPVSGL